MPRAIRTIDSDDNETWWANWYKFLKANGWRTLTPQEMANEANNLGISFDDFVAQYHAEYTNLRDTFTTEMDEQSESRQQLLQIRNNSLDSTCSVYQRADRILTGIDVTVQVSDDKETDTPAWNDGKVITFNSSAIKEIDEATITGLHGLNYHEIGHLLFTPRIGTDLGKWVTENDKQVPFNILEDAREEHLLVTKYPSVRPFLIATIGDYLIEDVDRLADSWILMAGRKYYSLLARQYSAALYADRHGLEQAKIVYALINEYRTLAFPRDYQRAKEIIEAFEPYCNGVETPNGCSQRTVLRNGRPESGKSQEQLQAAAAANDKADNVFDGPSTGQSNEGGDDKDGKPVNDKWNDDKEESLLQELEQQVRSAKSDKIVKDKVRDTQKAIKADSSTKTILPRQNGEYFPPALNEITASRSFSQELERLRIDSDPAWLRERPSGKLNVKRAMQADVNDINKLFDRWHIGNDDYDIEACILIDRSGSMTYDIGNACRAAWIIKRAIEKINGSVTVMTFNHASKVLLSAEQKATANIPIVEASGSTDPYYALLETERIMTQSRKATKLVFLLTDGQFYGGKNDNTIKRLNDIGCITNLIYLAGNDVTKKSLEERSDDKSINHGANNFRAIVNPMDLVKVAKDVVRSHLKAASR